MLEKRRGPEGPLSQMRSLELMLVCYDVGAQPLAHLSWRGWLAAQRLYSATAKLATSIVTIARPTIYVNIFFV